MTLYSTHLASFALHCTDTQLHFIVH